MFRAVASLGVLIALVGTATAQPVPTGAIPSAQMGRPNVFVPVIMPWGWWTGWGYQTYNPWTGYGYEFGGILPTTPAAPAPVVPERPTRPEPTVVLSQEFPATLSLQFPAAAEVWLDGKKEPGAANAERVLTSPVLSPNQKYTFDIKARWTTGSKTYEAKRSVTVGPGDRSRLLVVSGDEVRE
jgi:uncharacterized protein (TIGR03000 family)